MYCFVKAVFTGTFVYIKALKWMKGYFLVVDWHNYGWSILALSVSVCVCVVKSDYDGSLMGLLNLAYWTFVLFVQKPTWKCLVPLYRWIEQTFGAKADAAFCVSKAMEVSATFLSCREGKP